MDLKPFLGEKAGPYRKSVPEGQVADFCKAVGAQPLREAPPTFLTICRQGEFDLFQRMGIPLSQVLHAEQEYVYEKPVYGGDQLDFETVVTQVFSKKGSTGIVHFLAFETEIYAERGGAREKAASAKCTVVIR